QPAVRAADHLEISIRELGRWLARYIRDALVHPPPTEPYIQVSESSCRASVCLIHPFWVHASSRAQRSGPTLDQTLQVRGLPPSARTTTRLRVAYQSTLSN